MAWSARYDSKTNIIEVIYSGTLSMDDIKNAIIQRISIQEETGAMSVLADISGIDNVKVHLVDIFSIADTFFENINSDRRTRIALILPRYPKAREDALFYETACLNRGWKVKSFEDREEAIKWLLEMESLRKPAEDEN